MIHNFFERADDSPEWVFMRLFRKYLELDLYMSFDLHTSDTILSAERELIAFGDILTARVDYYLPTLTNLLFFMCRNIFRSLKQQAKKTGTFPKSTHTSMLVMI